MFSFRNVLENLNSVTGLPVNQASAFTQQAYDMLPRIGFEKAEALRSALQFQANMAFGPMATAFGLKRAQVTLNASPGVSRWYELSSMRHTRAADEMISLLTGTSDEGHILRGFGVGKNSFLYEITTQRAFSSRRYSFVNDEASISGFVDMEVPLAATEHKQDTGTLFCQVLVGPHLSAHNELFAILVADIMYGRAVCTSRKPRLEKPFDQLIKEFCAKVGEPNMLSQLSHLRLSLDEDEVDMLFRFAGLTPQERSSAVASWREQVNNLQGEGASTCHPTCLGYANFEAQLPQAEWQCTKCQREFTDRAGDPLGSFVVGARCGKVNQDLLDSNIQFLQRLAAFCRESEDVWQKVAQQAITINLPRN